MLTEPLLRSTIAADARLNDLAILRFATHSTFKISQHHADALAQLIEDSVDTAPQEKAKVEHTVWLYAPGENAEHWDEFYANGLMGIGWNGLGDLSKFGSLEDVLAAMQKEYQTDRRPTNNARTCYDFAHTMRTGDRVFVKRGRRTILGHGIVTGEYEHHPDREPFKNIRTVRWLKRGSWTSPVPVAIKTLTDITNDAGFVNEIDALFVAGKLQSSRNRQKFASPILLSRRLTDSSWKRSYLDAPSQFGGTRKISSCKARPV